MVIKLPGLLSWGKKEEKGNHVFPAFQGGVAQLIPMGSHPLHRTLTPWGTLWAPHVAGMVWAGVRSPKCLVVSALRCWMKKARGF